MNIKYQYVNWTQFYDLSLRLYKKIRASNFVPDVIVGVARGGWVPARIIADFYVTSYTANIKIEFYQGYFEADETPHITQAVSGETRWKRVLVVDDISDTGASLQATRNHLEHQKVAELQTACLHVKPWAQPLPDHYVESTDAWVIYPWELKEFTYRLVQQYHDENKSLSEAESRLMEIGLPKDPIRDFLGEWKKSHLLKKS